MKLKSLGPNRVLKTVLCQYLTAELSTDQVVSLHWNVDLAFAGLLPQLRGVYPDNHLQGSYKQRYSAGQHHSPDC